MIGLPLAELFALMITVVQADRLNECLRRIRTMTISKFLFINISGLKLQEVFCSNMLIFLFRKITSGQSGGYLLNLN